MVAELSEYVGLELGGFFDLLLRHPGPSSPGEDTVEIVHLFHDLLGAMAATNLELKESQASKSNHTGEQVAADLAVGPVEQGIDPHMTGGLARSELVFDAGAVERGSDDRLGRPGMVVCDNDVFAHQRLMSANLCQVFAKAHRAVGEGEMVVFGADVEILAELVVARGDLGRASPLGLPAVVLPAVLNEFAPQPLHLSREVVEFLALRHGIEGHHHRPLPAPQGKGAPIGEHKVPLSALLAECPVLGNVQGMKVLRIEPGELLGKVGGVGGDEVKLGLRIDASDSVLGVHPLVEDNRELSLAFAKATQNPEDLIHDLVKELGVVEIARIRRVVEGKRAFPVEEKPDANLPELVLAALVVASDSKLGLGLGRHVGEVVGGVEKEGFRTHRAPAPDCLKEASADLLHLPPGHPVPLLPVALGSELSHINLADMLDGALTIPSLEGSLALWGNHAIGPGIEEVIADRWSCLSGSPWHNAIDNADRIQLLFEHMGREESAEGLGPEPDGPFGLSSLFKPSEDSLRGAEVLLPLDPDLAADAVNFSRIPVGSALEGLFVEMSHGGIIGHRSYMSSRKCSLPDNSWNIPEPSWRLDRFYDRNDRNMLIEQTNSEWCRAISESPV